MRVLKVAWATVFVAATLSSSLAQSLSDLQALAVKRQAAETQDNEEVNRLRPALSNVMDDHVRAATAAIASQGVAFNDTKPILDEQVTNAARISFVAFEPVYLNTKRSIGAEGLLGVNSTYFLSPTGARSYVEIHASLFWLSASEACSYQVEIGVFGQTPSEAIYPCSSFASAGARSIIVDRVQDAVRQSLSNG